MRSTYAGWLREQGYDEGTAAAQLYRASRVEQYYGDLDGHFAHDSLEQVVQALCYSNDDERQGRPNPTLIPVVGVIRTNLASYRNAVQRYCRFCQAVSGGTESKGARPFPEQLLGFPYVENPKTLVDFRLDGLAAFESVITGSQYRSFVQAVASLALFSHPETVRQTGGKPIFHTVRSPRRVGEIVELGDRRVLLDDNKSASDAFLWANRIRKRGRDTQFNHVYAASANPAAYTSLCNICMTPAFIAKLTDTSIYIRQLLQYRSCELYDWFPEEVERPSKPYGYDDLDWALPLPPVADVRGSIISAMASKPKDRTVLAAQELGWLFDCVPEAALNGTAARQEAESVP